MAENVTVTMQLKYTSLIFREAALCQIAKLLRRSLPNFGFQVRISWIPQFKRNAVDGVYILLSQIDHFALVKAAIYDETLELKMQLFF